jgi:hypothetical protein
MHWDVRNCGILEHGRLNVVFEDGLKGEVELSPSKFRGVFEPLRDPAFFNQAYIDHGAVTWPNGADLAPDAMYEEIKKHGVWHIK